MSESLVTKEVFIKNEPEYKIVATQESEDGLYFGVKYAVIWMPNMTKDHIIRVGETRGNDPHREITEEELKDNLMRAINMHKRGVWKSS